MEPGDVVQFKEANLYAYIWTKNKNKYLIEELPGNKYWRFIKETWWDINRILFERKLWI